MCYLHWLRADSAVPPLPSSLSVRMLHGRHNYFGSSLRKTGYACLMPKLVSSWRALWSQTPGTTDPNAPFGVVTLASSGSEGGADIRQMGIAQTAGYVTLMAHPLRFW